MKLKIIDASWHRNGVCGAGFYAIIFKNLDEDAIMIASLFDESGYCSVYSIEELGKQNIEFANGNSWRGDQYECILRPLLKEYLKEKGTNRVGPFSSF